ncbi:MAG TPA: potassium transporter TrkG [Flavobacteriales bacterium]|nr:potassium transporter TrkG [Flavobacteriales bacterium]
MRRTLLRIVLRKEVLTTARLTAVFFIFLLFLSEFGFQASAGSAHLLEGLGFTLVCFSAIVTGAGLLRTVLVHDRIRRAEAIWLAGALVLIVLGPTGLHPWAPEANWPYLSFLMAFALIELSRLELGRNTRLFNPALLFAAGFVFMIALGTAFLMLPNAATRPLRFVDALFTATSAVCVTGLSTIDVSAGLTRSGQWLLLLLFQFGGLGIMTFTSFFAFFFKGRGSLEEQLRIRDIAQTTLGSARSFVVKVIAFSLGIEALGTVFCYLQLPATAFVDNGERLFFALFHSVSAFMNAGFSTWPAGLYTDSLRFNYPFQWTLIVLIVAGGLGFGIIFNFTRYLRSWVVERVRYWLQGGACQRFPRVITISSRLVLVTSAILLVAGTFAFLVGEWDRTLAEHRTWFGRFTIAFFTSATSRTAGFNVVDWSAVSVPVVMVVLLLMYVGGSPGSAAGGIKTSTFAIATLNIFSTARGRDRIEFLGREISSLSVRRAFATIVFSLITLGLSVAVVASLEPRIPLLPLAFECFSAYSTVGQSMGITAQLGDPTRYVMVVIMFVGRVSALTLLVGVLRQVTVTSYRYPKEDIQIN